jgi:hypothetical protein
MAIVVLKPDTTLDEQEARRRNASASRLRFSQFLASLRQRLSQGWHYWLFSS